MPRVDLTPRLARDCAAGPRETILFDRGQPGFGLRVHPSGRKVYVLQARIKGRTRRFVVARHGEVELAEARRRARDLLARIRAGEDPAEERRRARRVPDFSAFAGEYLRRCAPNLKPSGRRTVRTYLKARLLPAFGRTPVDRIGPEDVAAWFDAASAERPGAANRAFEILRAMMFRAEEWGWRPPGTNPCLGIAKNPRRNVARCLDAGELERLGRALDGREAGWPEAVAAIRLIALTGCRRSEVLDRRWRDIGDDAIRLPDAKTGPRTVPLGAAARDLVAAIAGPIDTTGSPRTRDPDAFLFPRYAEGRGQHSLASCWHAVRADARLGALRLHDLRHTVASQAVMSGENLPQVGRLLGHRSHRTTEAYTHLADGHLAAAAERIGGIIAGAMAGGRRSWTE